MCAFICSSSSSSFFYTYIQCRSMENQGSVCMLEGMCFFHACEYGVFKAIPVRSVGICIKVVHAVFSDALCGCIYVSSGEELTYLNVFN